jgi:hypothetical protein
MRLDPVVNRRKYDRELNGLERRKDVLERQGIFLLTTAVYPIIECIVVPKHPLRVAVPVTQQGQLFLPPGARAVLEVPGLSASAFKARFNLTDYDLEAPSLEFRDPWSDSILQFRTMFRALQYDTERRVHVVLLDDHPITHKPFLCLRGIREYHNHPQHSGDEWLLYRAHMNMFSILMSLWRVASDLVHPMLLIHENGLQVQWTGEEKP